MANFVDLNFELNGKILWLVQMISSLTGINYTVGFIVRCCCFCCRCCDGARR